MKKTNNEIVEITGTIEVIPFYDEETGKAPDCFKNCNGFEDDEQPFFHTVEKTKVKVK